MPRLRERYIDAQDSPVRGRPGGRVFFPGAGIMGKPRLCQGEQPLGDLLQFIRITGNFLKTLAVVRGRPVFG